jgi:cytochrome-b5 reductase
MAEDQHHCCVSCILLSAGGIVLALGLLWRWLHKRKPVPVVHLTEYKGFKLIEKTLLTKGSVCSVLKFRFALDSKDDSLQLPVGQHLSVRCFNPENGKLVSRSYTPTSSNDDKGFFDLVVKIYPTGIMSQYLNHMEVGSGVIEVRGPKGKFIYKPNHYSCLGMLAGGSGITPMYQIMLEMSKRRDVDSTKASLIYGNLTEEDIILRSELQSIVDVDKNRFSLYHVLNEAPQNWDQGTGFITPEVLKSKLPSPQSPNVMVLLCGPPPMISAMLVHLAGLGFNKESQIYCF